MRGFGAECHHFLRRAHHWLLAGTGIYFYLFIHGARGQIQIDRVHESHEHYFCDVFLSFRAKRIAANARLAAGSTPWVIGTKNPCLWQGIFSQLFGFIADLRRDGLQVFDSKETQDP
jgi:hypothetical protein